jgi:AAA domain/Toprim-like
MTSIPTLNDIRAAFPQGEMRGDEWVTLCPVHGDTGKKSPNLRIRVDGSRVLAYCNAGCDQFTVWNAVAECLKGEHPPVPPSTAKEDPVHFPYTAERIATAERVLLQTKTAQQFLASRGISLEIAKALHIGYEDGRVLLPTFAEDGALVAAKLRAITPNENTSKWLKYRRDKGQYWLFNREAAFLADDVWVVESELDAAMLVGQGFAAVSVDSAGHRLNPKDTELLKAAKRVLIATDADSAGQTCADRLIATVGRQRCLRILPEGAKDLGELYEDRSDTFADRLKKIVRLAEVTRPDFGWNDLLTETEIIDHQGLELKYAVDQLIPLRRLTMLFGPEKSCKSLLAFYMGKCVANGARVLDNFAVEKMPCLYLDAEDGIIGQYVGWMKGIGPEQVRFRTLLTGLPALDEPSLLDVCRTQKPLLIIDSLHKFLGNNSANVWRSNDLEPVLQKLRLLCVAGATVVLIHHATKSDPEQYRDSSAIGAGVDFLYAVVGEQPVGGVTRIRMVGKPSRGAHPPTLNLLAFPALIDFGKFTLEDEPPKTNVDRVVEYVSAQPTGATKRGVREGLKGIGDHKKDKALEEAVERGLLNRDSKGVYTVAERQPRSGELLSVARISHTSAKEVCAMPL